MLTSRATGIFFIGARSYSLFACSPRLPVGFRFLFSFLISFLLRIFAFSSCTTHLNNEFGQLIDASFRPIFSTLFEDRNARMQFYVHICDVTRPPWWQTWRKTFIASIWEKKTHDRPTDRPTDWPSYRDARTHLKKPHLCSQIHNC